LRRISAQGWRTSADDKDPIFPIVMRPSRPLPPLPSTAERPAKRAKTDAAKPVKARSLTRARRVKVDPTKWAPTHVRDDDLEELAANAPAFEAAALASSVHDSESSDASSSDAEPDPPPPAAVDSAASTSSSSSEGEDEAVAPAQSSTSDSEDDVRPTSPPPVPPRNQLSSSLFAKGAAGGFSLGSLLDEHDLVDDDEVIMEDIAHPLPAPAPPSRSVKVAAVATPTDLPMFFPSATAISNRCARLALLGSHPDPPCSFRLHEGLCV
jgi:hypothetical protein